MRGWCEYFCRPSPVGLALALDVQPTSRRGKPKLFDGETLVAVERAKSHRVMISSWGVTSPI